MINFYKSENYIFCFKSFFFAEKLIHSAKEVLLLVTLSCDLTSNHCDILEPFKKDAIKKRTLKIYI